MMSMFPATSRRLLCENRIVDGAARPTRSQGSDHSGIRFGLLWGNGNHCDGEAWMILQGDFCKADLERYHSDALVLRFEESFTVIETTDTWRVSGRGRIGTAGPDLRCNQHAQSHRLHGPLHLVGLQSALPVS